MIDWALDGAAAAIALIGAHAYRGRLAAIHEHERAVLEHEQVMKYGRPEPKIVEVDKIVVRNADDKTVNCTLCSRRYDTVAYQLPMCGACRRRLFRDERVIVGMYADYAENSGALDVVDRELKASLPPPSPESEARIGAVLNPPPPTLPGA